LIVQLRLGGRHIKNKPNATFCDLPASILTNTIIFMKKFIQFALVGVIALAMVACGKSKEEILTEKPWNVTSFMFGDDDLSMAQWKFTFKADGEFLITSLVDNSSGTWAFINDEAGIKTTIIETGEDDQVIDWTIVTLEEGSLKVTATQTIDDDGEPVTINISVEATN
jgi:hypothetical protein